MRGIVTGKRRFGHESGGSADDRRFVAPEPFMSTTNPDARWCGVTENVIGSLVQGPRQGSSIRSDPLRGRAGRPAFRLS